MSKQPRSYDQARALINFAWKELEKDRKGFFKGKARAFRRGWKYGEGKKTAKKVGIGVGVAVAFTVVGVATAGAGVATVAVVAALAVGGYAAGQAASGSMAVLGSKSNRGLPSVTGWLNSEQAATTAFNLESARALDERAYSLTRRAYEHYRTAYRKARDIAITATELKKQNPAQIDCGQVLGMVAAMLSISHHLLKARLYLEPTIHFQRVLLRALDDWRTRWDSWYYDMREVIHDALKREAADSPGGCGPNCFQKKGADRHKFEGAEELWDAKTIAGHDTRLNTLFHKLAPAPRGRPYLNVHGDALTRASRMFRDVQRWHDTNREALGLRMRHWISNTFARKTRGEVASFGLSQTAGVAITAASGSSAMVQAVADAALPPSVVSQTLDQVIKALTELGKGIGQNMGETAGGMVGDQLAGIAGDRIAFKGDSEDADLNVGRDSAAAATENRDLIRKAAQHIYKANEHADALGVLKDTTIDGCEHAVETAEHVLVVYHHLSKAQRYLEESLNLTFALGDVVGALQDRMDDSTIACWQWAAVRVAHGDHRVCDLEDSYCYGPSQNDRATPRVPLI
jgi:hypothetical protein